MAFPMRHRWQNILMAAVALALGLLVNSFRLVLLTLITASEVSNKKWWFELFHTGWPSLLFPGIAMLLFVQLYLMWMEHQVAQLEGS
jgi:exosortase/archaeosortase family protein